MTNIDISEILSIRDELSALYGIEVLYIKNKNSLTNARFIGGEIINDTRINLYEDNEGTYFTI